MTAPDPLIARRNQIPRGIFYMVLSTVMFAGVNAIVKWEVALYPVGEVAFFRSAFAFFAVCGLILPRTGLAVLRTNRYREHLQRGLSQFGSMTCMFLAFRALSLGSAIAISFSAPLFTTLLSILILKEKVGLHRWSALIVGFIGVVVAIRRMSATESTETLTVYQMTVITLCTMCLLPFGFTPPAWLDFVGLAFAGIGNGIAQYWWTRSLSLAPPSAVVPFNYLSLIWAAMLGFAIWGDVPTASLLVGSMIVVASGLYILWRETLRRPYRPVPAQPAAEDGPVRPA